ncbi:MAG: GIY-YIG nuclease family protein [Candidatus Kerfeldbacteria bacterium]|nr:GIY-YIG nuclease family protein [Candidatus Kerfeldbacteria bacterium]
MASWYYVYVLRSLKDNEFYTGRTAHLRSRLQQHNRGENTSTAKRLPMKLVYFEAHHSWVDAARRERYLKSTKGKRTLKQMLRSALGKSVPG